MKNPIEVYLYIYEQKSYEYFDKNIRKLSRNEAGEFDRSGGKLQNNDADAFRHAYLSGVMVRHWGESIAEKMGLVIEWRGKNPENQKNMDLWNNSVGRMYGKKAQSLDELLDLLRKALENGELIISVGDSRKYIGQTIIQFDINKPIIVLEESETGRNELFFDLSNGDVFDRDGFVAAITNGEYHGYVVASIDKISTPMSKPDSIILNNLG
jgi:hypothetical protein